MIAAVLYKELLYVRGTQYTYANAPPFAYIYAGTKYSYSSNSWRFVTNQPAGGYTYPSKLVRVCTQHAGIAWFTRFTQYAGDL